MSKEVNRRESALIEAASAGDAAAAHALLDHLRDQDEEALANELTPLLQAEDGARKVAYRLSIHRINRAMKTFAIPITDAMVAIRKALTDTLAPAAVQLARIDWRALAAATQEQRTRRQRQ
jgi:hypothetical protein